ncbi:MAG: efflux transporter outer membrane subunit [Gammaproteobacteria bacterium]|nr:efflux transporter outer membrane subunit [Gammaproteobacteria bacterium]
MKRISSTAAGLVVTLLAGCATVGPDYVAPKTATTDKFANVVESGLTAEQIETQWWKRLNDPALDELIQRALAANHDLRIAVARLKEARAIYRDTELDYFPSGDVAATAQHGRNSEAQALGGDRDVELYSLGFDAAWELDLFGRVRRAVEAAEADAQAAEANVRDARVSVIAEVARNYFEYRGAELQLAVARRNLDNQKQTYKFTELRLDAGRGTQLDVARAATQFNVTAAAIPLQEIAVKRAQHRLAVLLGESPATFKLTAPAGLPALTAAFPVGKPEELLRRRPDIRIAERQLAASTARIGVATADLFPRVTLSGFLGFVATSGSGLGRAASESWNLSPTLSWAAFDLGSVRARLRASEARSEASLALYERTVLRALEETENALVGFGRQQSRLAALRAAAQSATRATEFARLRYDEGATDFLSLLDAERTQLEAESGVAEAEAQAYTALIAVYKTLGGGWET